MPRFVIVSDVLMQIINGPVLWDARTPMPLPSGQRLVAEGDPSLATYAPPPTQIALSLEGLAQQVADLKEAFDRREGQSVDAELGALLAVNQPVDVTVTWPVAFPSDAYRLRIAPARVIRDNAGSSVVKKAQTAAAATVTVRAGVLLALGTKIATLTGWC